MVQERSDGCSEDSEERSDLECISKTELEFQIYIGG